jgi:uncharacterized protein YsxB (DUF464 family)
MVAFVVLENNEGQVLGFEAHGHAGSAPRGENLACAAASLLIQTLVTGIKDEVRVPLEVQEGAGGGLSCCFARVPAVSEQEKIDFLVRVVERGLRALQQMDTGAAVCLERKQADL